MQEQHVQTTIRPLVCDLLTTRRGLEKLKAQEVDTCLRLKKRLQQTLDRSFKKICEHQASLGVRTHADWSIRSLESNGTGPLRLLIALKVPKEGLTQDETALLRALYFKFKESCVATLASVDKLAFQFEEI